MEDRGGRDVRRTQESKDVKGKEGSHLVEAFLVVNRDQRIGEERMSLFFCIS